MVRKQKLIKSLFFCLWILGFGFWTLSCGSAVMTGEDYGDIMGSPSGLTLTEGEHASGWGRADCYVCHNVYNIHIGTSESGFDMAAVRKQVEEEGLASCPTCHGANGVE